MRERGYMEGRNLVIEWRFAERKYERLPALAQDLIRANVDVIVAASEPAIAAAMQLSKTIPIVMVTSVDPVGDGLIAGLRRPGGNVTGLANLIDEVAPKQLELLITAIPSVRRIALLVNPDNPSHRARVMIFREAAQRLEREVLPIDARNDDEIEQGFAAMVKQGAGALVVSAEPLFTDQPRQIAAHANRRRLPSVGTQREYVRAGGLVSYGYSLTDNYQHAAAYVDKIIKGAKPADLPVEQPTRLYLAINLNTGRALGVTIPRELLLRADEVIE